MRTTQRRHRLRRAIAGLAVTAAAVGAGAAITDGSASARQTWCGPWLPGIDGWYRLCHWVTWTDGKWYVEHTPY